MYTMREKDQNPETIRQLVAMFVECPEDVDPIVVVGNDRILDGHHRAVAAEQAGATVRVSHITNERYESLKAAGYDDMEIAAAAHIAADNDEAADHLNAQFPGAGIIYRAYDAVSL